MLQTPARFSQWATRLEASESVRLVDVVERQLEGGGREGLWHSIAGVASVRRGHGCVLLQSGQSGCVGSVVCDGDVPSPVKAAGCWEALDVVGHGVDGSDWTTLGHDEEKERGFRKEFFEIKILHTFIRL